jgi:hypothetical protein
MAELTEESRQATLAFARTLRDPRFRKFLSGSALVVSEETVIALPEEQTADVFDRMFAQTRGPALIAIWRPGADFDFVFMAASNGQRAGEPVEVGSGATIGMLYDTLAARSGQYVIPQSWTTVRTLVGA